MRLSVDVKDSRLQEVADAIFTLYPKEDKTLTDKEWVETLLRRYLIEIYKAGKNLKTMKDNRPDEDI